jgi:hypothetical protein
MHENPISTIRRIWKRAVLVMWSGLLMRRRGRESQRSPCGFPPRHQLRRSNIRSPPGSGILKQQVSEHVSN